MTATLISAPVDLCEKCGQIHPPLVECVMVLQRTIRDLLLKTGRLDRCGDPGCRQSIFWVTTLEGRPRAYNENGVWHAKVCTGVYRR